MYAEPLRRRNVVRPSPWFGAFIAVAVLGGVLSWTDSIARSARVGVFLLVIGGWVVSVCLHEFGHAYTAYRAGDRSVEAAGYLTLNPFKYAHPLLSVVLPLIFIAQGGIGLPGGAVYLHRHSFATRAQQSAAAAAGPISNLAFAAVLLALVHAYASPTHGTFWSGVAFLGFLQISAAVLNLLPVPGLDGYAIIEPYLDPRTARSLDNVKPFGMLGVYLLLQINQLNSWFFTVVGR
ncbi:MAG: site-2 protease family protein, partial [Actinobacteria bacterium]|nr:site-2 protease family protein [Actinomycetota bacterium]